MICASATPLFLLVFLLFLLPAAPAFAQSWNHFHGNAANTGLVDTTTAPATVAAFRVEGLGDFAPGAGPVIAPDGTIYVGNKAGQLIAISPSGQRKWMRDTPGQKIIAPPVIGADGSIYVVGTKTMRIRDHRGGEEKSFVRHEASLHRFVPGGGMLWVRPLPELNERGAGATSAAPSIWRSGGTEVILIPTLHMTLGGYQLRLVAFSDAGGMLFDHKVTGFGFGDVTGGASASDFFCAWVPLCFNRMFGLEETVPIPGTDEIPPDAEPPMPGVGLFGGSTGGQTPVIVVADNYQNIVGYNFSLQTGFTELFRKHLTNDQLKMSAPVLLRDGHSIIRGNGKEKAWLLFGGPSVVNWTEVPVPLTGSTPTLTADGRVVIVDRDKGVTVIGLTPTRGVIGSVKLDAQSIAPAAASCSHVFVSTADSLVTLDAKAEQKVTQFFWRGGGLSSPAIGANGTVAALAGDSLHIFAAPPQRRPAVVSCLGRPGAGGLGGVGGGGIITR